MTTSTAEPVSVREMVPLTFDPLLATMSKDMGFGGSGAGAALAVSAGAAGAAAGAALASGGAAGGGAGSEVGADAGVSASGCEPPHAATTRPRAMRDVWSFMAPRCPISHARRRYLRALVTRRRRFRA